MVVGGFLTAFRAFGTFSIVHPSPTSPPPPPPQPFIVTGKLPILSHTRGRPPRGVVVVAVKVPGLAEWRAR